MRNITMPYISSGVTKRKNHISAVLQERNLQTTLLRRVLELELYEVQETGYWSENQGTVAWRHIKINLTQKLR